MTTYAYVSVLPGQSNNISLSTGGIAYLGGFTPTSLGAGYAEAIWNGSTWVQYNPGVQSSFFGGTNPQYWGIEAPIALLKRAQTPQVCSYFVKYAQGGVGLAPNQGQRGASSDGNSWSPYQTGKALDAFCTFLSSAVAPLISLGITPIIKECFWVGNESDCFEWASASSVEHDLPAFIAAIRTRFSSPNMKFIIARTKSDLGSGASPSPGQLPYVDIVRAGQQAAGCGYRCAWVNTDDFGAPTVSLGHYNPVDVVTLGQRMFAAAEAITP